MKYFSCLIHNFSYGVRWRLAKRATRDTGHSHSSKKSIAKCNEFVPDSSIIIFRLLVLSILQPSRHPPVPQPHLPSSHPNGPNPTTNQIVLCQPIATGRNDGRNVGILVDRGDGRQKRPRLLHWENQTARLPISCGYLSDQATTSPLSFNSYNVGRPAHSAPHGRSLPPLTRISFSSFNDSAARRLAGRTRRAPARTRGRRRAGRAR